MRTLLLFTFYSFKWEFERNNNQKYGDLLWAQHFKSKNHEEKIKKILKKTTKFINF